jgi:uncharacterized protein with HEPN domain
MYSKDDLLCFNILESINRIIEFTEDLKDVEAFHNDHKGYDATIMNFIVIGEMTEKLSDEFKEINSDIEWHKLYGFRNILAHNYFGINRPLIWDIIKNDIPKLKIEIEKILN